MRVIDGCLPVCYKDLVKVRFVVGRILEMVRYSTPISPPSTSDVVKRLSLTRRGKVPRTPGEVRTENQTMITRSGGSRGDPRRGVGREYLSSIQTRSGSKRAIDGAGRGGMRFRQHCGERKRLSSGGTNLTEPPITGACGTLTIGISRRTG